MFLDILFTTVAKSPSLYWRATDNYTCIYSLVV